MNSKKDYYKLFAELFCYVYRIYFNEIVYEQPIITKNVQLILHNIKKYITHYTKKEDNQTKIFVEIKRLCRGFQSYSDLAPKLAVSHDAA